jgi:DNA topoisomerase VI subunit B
MSNENKLAVQRVVQNLLFSLKTSSKRREAAHPDPTLKKALENMSKKNRNMA